MRFKGSLKLQGQKTKVSNRNIYSRKLLASNDNTITGSDHKQMGPDKNDTKSVVFKTGYSLFLM